MLVLAKAALSSWWQGPLLVAFLFQIPLLQWLSVALLALIALRQGFQAGAVAFVALCGLTALMSIFAGPQLALPTVGLMACVATLGAAQVLRISRSQSLSWFCAAVIMVGAYGLCEAQFPMALAQYKQYALQMIEAWVAGVPAEDRDALLGGAPALAVQAVVTLPLMLTAIALLLARFWQAKLFNPGGFALEFQSIRLEMPLAMVCIVLWLVFYSLGNAMMYGLANVFLLPFLVAGVGLFHWLARFRQLGFGWYVAFYMFFIFLQFGVVLIATLDSFFDLRSRLSRRYQSS